MRELTARCGTKCMVDDDVYEMYSKYRWYLSNGYFVFGEARDGIKSFQKLHRLIMNAPKGALVDHRNRNKLDNTRGNLRLVDLGGNVHNQRKRINTKNNFKGTQYIKGLNAWQGRCRINGDDHFLGHYKSEIAAAYAYNKKASELSETILLNELPLSVEDLELLLITDRVEQKRAKQISRYKYIFLKAKAGRMKSDKWSIWNPAYKLRKGYFFTEHEAVEYYLEHFNNICPIDIKKEFKRAA